MGFKDILDLVDGINLFSLGAYKSSDNIAFGHIHDNLLELRCSIEQLEKDITNGNTHNQETKENT